MGISFALILFSVALSATGQLLLKVGMDQVGQFEFAARNIIPISFKVITNLPVVGGVSLYVISLVIWLMVLSRTDVSLAYPMISLGYVVNAIAAHYLLGEELSPLRLSGVFIIVVGVCLISRS